MNWMGLWTKWCGADDTRHNSKYKSTAVAKSTEEKKKKIN